MEYEKKISTIPFQEFYVNSCNTPYVKKRGSHCGFTLSDSQLSTLKNEQILVYYPIISEYSVKAGSFGILPESEGTKIKDLAELTKHFDESPNTIKKTYIENEEFRTYLLAIPLKKKFNVYLGKQKKYSVSFTENIAYMGKDGIVFRKIKIIEEFNLPPAKNIREALKDQKKTKKIQSNSSTENKVNVAKGAINNSKNNQSNKPQDEKYTFVDCTGISHKDVFYLFEKSKAIKELQIIKSSNNHVTRKHTVEERKVNLVAYSPKEKKFSCIPVVVHYCSKCKMYFDFYESFVKQLKANKIDVSRFLVAFKNDMNEPFEFEMGNLRNNSRLNLFGYRAGASGQSSAERQRLITRLIQGNYMSPSEIKSHLSFLIRFHSENPNMSHALNDWDDDIYFINKHLMKKL